MASPRTCAKTAGTSRTPTSGSPKRRSPPLNFECAATPRRCSPWPNDPAPVEVTLVPERREEVTTEGRTRGAPARHTSGRFRHTAETRGGAQQSVHRPRSGRRSAVPPSSGPTPSNCTPAPMRTTPTIRPRSRRCATATQLGRSLGLAVHAGHGLTVAATSDPSPPSMGSKSSTSDTRSSAAPSSSDWPRPFAKCATPWISPAPARHEHSPRPALVLPSGSRGVSRPARPVARRSRQPRRPMAPRSSPTRGRCAAAPP
jgi:hypothetical protein